MNQVKRYTNHLKLIDYITTTYPGSHVESINECADDKFYVILTYYDKNNKHVGTWESRYSCGWVKEI
jgi:hypothetical protein